MLQLMPINAFLVATDGQIATKYRKLRQVELVEPQHSMIFEPPCAAWSKISDFYALQKLGI